MRKELDDAALLVAQSPALREQLESTAMLPVGVGVQMWQGNVSITTSILHDTAEVHAPCAVWLFAPRSGQMEVTKWIQDLRRASPRTRIWLQVASVQQALTAAHDAVTPDVLVLQGSDAGGHSLTQGASVVTLVPEVNDRLGSVGSIPLIAAGGIIDGRGAAAALSLGSSGVALGTRFLAASEARVRPGYQQAVLQGQDGGQATVRTQLYNHLRGTTGWPDEYDARGIANASWRDYKAGMGFDENKRLHDEAVNQDEDAGLFGKERGRTATYAGTGIGLVNEVILAGEITRAVRGDAISNLRVTMDIFTNMIKQE